MQNDNDKLHNDFRHYNVLYLLLQGVPAVSHLVPSTTGSTGWHSPGMWLVYDGPTEFTEVYGWQCSQVHTRTQRNGWECEKNSSKSIAICVTSRPFELMYEEAAPENLLVCYYFTFVISN